MANKFNLLAASAVALVVLVDLATGQGPPIYTSYLQQQQENGFHAAPPQQAIYRAEYEPSKKVDKEYKDAIELGKASFIANKGVKKYDTEYQSEYEDDKKDYKKKEEEPGMLSSLSNRMSGAWKTISSLGREKRAVNELATVANETSTKMVDAKVSGHQNKENYQQSNNQGYIYFKVPKNLICGQ